jgi:hypothetical protein
MRPSAKRIAPFDLIWATVTISPFASFRPSAVALFAFTVPVEVVAFGLEVTQAALEALGASARLRLSATGAPFITDSGNRILDCNFGSI